MKNIILAASLLSTAVAIVGCASQTTPQKSAAITGYDNAKTCIACHGADGKSGKPEVPPIGQMSYDELKAAIDELKGANLHTPSFADMLTEQDIRDISGYFAEVNKK